MTVIDLRDLDQDFVIVYPDSSTRLGRLRSITSNTRQPTLVFSTNERLTFEETDQRVGPAGAGSGEGQVPAAEAVNRLAEIHRKHYYTDPTVVQQAGDFYVKDPVTGIGYILTVAPDGQIVRIRHDGPVSQRPVVGGD